MPTQLHTQLMITDPHILEGQAPPHTTSIHHIRPNCITITSNHTYQILLHKLTPVAIHILSQLTDILHRLHLLKPTVRVLIQVLHLATTNITSRLGHILHQDDMTSSHILESQTPPRKKSVHHIQPIRYVTLIQNIVLLLRYMYIPV